MASNSNLRRLAIVAGLTLGASASLIACFACNDIGCAGGFRWEGVTADQQPLDPGAVTLELEVEDSTYAVACSIGETMADTSCDEPERMSGEQEFSIFVQVLAVGEPEDWDPELAPAGFAIDIADVSGSAPDDSYSETRGPSDVTVTVLHGNEVLTSDAHADLEYDRDDAYRGDPACGFCDEELRLTHKW